MVKMNPRYFKRLSIERSNPIEGQTLEITVERYEELLEVEMRLKAITEVAEVDNGTYGYTESTARTIDILLGIERKNDEK